MRTFVLAVCLSYYTLSLRADALRDRMDAYVRRYADSDFFSGVVRVTKGDRIDQRGATCLVFASRTALHSARRATTGSTRAARCAGNQQASATAAESTAPPPIHAKILGAGISAH
jgi:hypothetical protein